MKIRLNLLKIAFTATYKHKKAAVIVEFANDV